MSQITTHVLDISTGKPANGIKIKLFALNDSRWNEIANGITGNDGRITNLLPKDKKLVKGIYKMNFDTGKYFDVRSIKRFYPYVEIVFDIGDEDHYHIPLLVSPFGYSTYRGS